ncbi:mitochondrial translation [Sparganum proliferum]
MRASVKDEDIADNWARENGVWPICHVQQLHRSDLVIVSYFFDITSIGVSAAHLRLWSRCRFQLVQFHFPQLGMSAYTKRMALLANRIFVDYGRPLDPKSAKVIKVMSEQPEAIKIKDWYPPLEEYSNILATLRRLGLFRDEHADFRDEMNRLRALRGKPRKTWGKKSEKG